MSKYLYLNKLEEGVGIVVAGIGAAAYGYKQMVKEAIREEKKKANEDMYEILRKNKIAVIR